MKHRFHKDMDFIPLSKREGLILLVFFLAMLWIHRYIFLYADDLYYSRDAQYGLDYLPYALLHALNLNGRAWIAGAMVLVLKPQIELFRILNPVMLVLAVIILAKITTFKEESMQRSYTFREGKKSNPSLWIALLCASLFFTFLPLKIAHTTIYYAACAFNYLYPMILAFFYAYLLYTRILSKSPRQKVLLALFGFFVGSSTQQVGMIGIGFTIMISVYLSLLLKKVPFRAFIPFYFTTFLGYGVVTYGSFKRLLWEKSAGNDAILMEVLSELLKTNIFSLPAAPFVLLVSLSCVFWLFAFSRSVPTTTVKAEFESSMHKNRPREAIFNRSLATLLSLALMGYIYFLLYKGTPIDLTGGNIFTFKGLGIIAFALVYLFGLIYTSAMVLIKENYPFLLFSSINAIGAQLMLIIVDARFAASYKVMFPSLLLMSIFIFYSVLAFRKNTLYLTLAFFLVTLSLKEKSLILLGTVVLLFWIINFLLNTASSASMALSSRPRTSLLLASVTVLFILVITAVFSTNLLGYYQASLPQKYNLEAIKRYHEADKKGVLVLQKVPPSPYGYNLGNWNHMPYFMKECYGIKEDTPIQYIN